MNLTSKFDTIISTAETDFKSRILPGAFQNLLIQAAIYSAENLGFGFNELRKLNLFWVLSKITIEIEKVPVWNDKVSIETWPKAIDRLQYLRDFLIYDSSNQIIGRATSSWLAIDRDSKRPKLVKHVNSDYFDQLRHISAIDEIPEKLSPLIGETLKSITSEYTDIDLNGHVTATRYLDWVMNAFPMKFLMKNYPKRIQINYLKETMPGEIVELIRQQKSELEYEFEGVNHTMNKPAFRVRLIF